MGEYRQYGKNRYYIDDDGKWHNPARPGRRAPALAVRDFKAGVTDDLTWSFGGMQGPINEVLRHNLRQMRQRSRDLFNNNDYGKKFIRMVQKNVIGVKGIKLQARTMRDSDNLDLIDNALIERAWQLWGKPFNCSVDNKLSWHDIQKLAIASVARDGECIIQIIETPRRGMGIRLRILPAEYLDEMHNGDLPNGNTVVMGIEYDPNGMVVAYHLRKNKVRSWMNLWPEREYLRIPAEDIIHLHVTDYAEQARGIPWAHSAIRRLHMIGKYEEAELVGSTLSSSKMGFLKSATGDAATPTEIYGPGDIDDDGEIVQEITPGMIEQIGHDADFVPFDPQHPTTAFEGFMRAVIRGAAAGLDVAYSTLSNDLENVNFSSIRAGVLDERDSWRMIQAWLIEHLHSRVYNRWLPAAIINGALPLPFKKVDTKYQDVAWQARGWPWVDPKNDSVSNRENIRMGTTSRQKVMAQSGDDFDEVLNELRYEKQRAEALDVNIADFEQSATVEGEGNEQTD